MKKILIFVEGQTEEKFVKDILYSYFVYNLRPQHNESLEKIKSSVDLLMKNITVVNYKFSNLENCSLKQYINEFIKTKY